MFFPAASSRRPCAPYSSLVSSLRRVKFFVCLWFGDAVCRWWQKQLAGKLTTLQRASCGGTPLASDLFNKGSQLTCARSVPGTRNFCFLAVLLGTGPFSLHTSLLRRKLSCLERTLEHLCSVQEKDALTACMKERNGAHWRRKHQGGGQSETVQQ